MSKMATLGFSPRYANLNLNIGPSGIITDVDTYHEVRTKTREQVAWMQTQFRINLLKIYTREDSIDNLCVNIILENGFQGVLYRHAAKYFTLGMFQYMGAYNAQPNEQILATFARAAVYTMESVVNELRVVKQHDSSQNWFNYLSNFMGIPEVGFFRQVRKTLIDNQQQHTATPQGGYGGQPAGGYPQAHAPQQSGGMNYPSQPANGGYAPAVTPQQHYPQAQSVDNNSAIKNPYLGNTDTTPVSTPVVPTATAPTASAAPMQNKAEVVDNILMTNGDTEGAAFIAGNRRQCPGMWMTDTVEGGEYETADYTDYILIGNGFEVDLADVKAKAHPLEHYRGWSGKIDQSITAYVENKDKCDYWVTLGDTNWDSVIVDALKLKKKLLAQAVIDQLNFYTNQNEYYCGPTDRVWNEDSWYDLLCKQFGEEALESIPDADLQYTLIGHRVYPVILAKSNAARKFAKRYRDEGSTLPSSQSDNHAYIIIPFWNDDLTKQKLEVCSLIRKGAPMDTSKYEKPQIAAAPVKTTDADVAVDESTTVSKTQIANIIESDKVYPGCEPFTTANLMYIDTAAGPQDAVLAERCDINYIIMTESRDIDFFKEIRERVGISINDIESFAGEVILAKEEDTISDTLYRQIESFIGQHLVGLVNSFNIADLTLDGSALVEVGDLKSIVMDLDNEEHKLMFINAERSCLNLLFAEYEDDYMATLANHFKAITDYPIRYNHKKHRANIPGVDGTVVLGEGIIPLVIQDCILAIPMADVEFNPDNVMSLNADSLGPVALKAIKRRWQALTGDLAVVTRDGISYVVSDVDMDTLGSVVVTRR